MPHQRLLVVDDDPLMREFAEEALRRAGYLVTTASSGSEALEQFHGGSFDAVLTDLKMTPMSGQQLLQEILQLSPEIPVIVMTAYGTIETAVAALKTGAADYILKPFTPDVLELAVARALERAALKAENQYLRQEINAAYDFASMVGTSPAIQRVYDDIQKIAATRATVLIRGESGTGKELVARAIHHNGPRRPKPFIKVNCAALSAGILESELFGHEKGAFTSAHERKIGRFELADKGTLLLDEISEIGIELQPKLLRALQEREFERVGGTQTLQVDTRIVATSNRDLEDAVARERFREDLFYRLNVIAVQLPPLRERREDIPALMQHFLQRYNTENARRFRGFGTSAQKLFMDYPWPGNVRELQNAIERAVVLADGETLEAEHFSLGDLSRTAGVGRGLNAGMTVAEMEKELIMRTLDHCAQNRTRAADMLGISVRTLRNKLHEYRGQPAAADATDEDE